MGKWLRAGWTALVVLGVTAPEGNAAVQIIDGSVRTGTSLSGECSAFSTCLPFFAAGCPQTLARADGEVASVVDITHLQGRSVDFTFSDATTRLYDEVKEATEGPAPVSTVYFFVASSCSAPSWAAFVLTSHPTERTATVRIPDDAKWLVVAPSLMSADLTWWGE